MNSRLVLQHDWNEVLRNPDGVAWVGLKKPGEPGIYGDLKGLGKADDGTPYATASEGFSIKSISKSGITLRYDDLDLTTEFRTPRQRFSMIHEAKKSVGSVDVTSGGLGVSADMDGNLRIWQTETGEVRRELIGHAGDVYKCRFFPSGVVVLSAGADTRLMVWDVTTGKCAATLTGHSMAVTDTAIVERGRNVLSCSRDGTAKLWCVSSGRCLDTFSPEQGLLHACAVGPVDNSVGLAPSQQLHDDEEQGTEGKLLLVACERDSLKAYDLRSRQQVMHAAADASVTCCCFLSATSVAYGTENGRLTQLDLRNTSQPLSEWQDSEAAVLSLTPHCGKLYVSRGDGSVYSLSASSRHRDFELTGSDCDPVYACAAASDYLYAACRDGSIRKYSLS